jgi:hypothetical protein
MNTIIIRNTPVTCRLVPEAERMDFVDKLFGINVRCAGANRVRVRRSLADEYHGGYWQFFELSNDGFYMALQVRHHLFGQLSERV